MAIAPAFLHPRRNHSNLHYPTKLHKNPSSTTFETAKNRKCLNITLATISATLLILPILTTMCGITVRWVMRSRKFWPGYLHSNPRYGTTTSKPVGSKTWEAGSCRLRNIGIGLGVSVGVILVVQPCFATEVQELAKHTLGKREDTWGNKGIANKL